MGKSMAHKEDRRTRKQRKDSQLLIRINAGERERFVDLCDSLDTSAAREIRRFIRKFITRHAGAAD